MSHAKTQRSRKYGSRKIDKRKLLSIALIAAGVIWFFWDGIGDIVSPPKIIPPATTATEDILAITLPGETLTQASRSKTTPGEVTTLQEIYSYSGGTAITQKIEYGNPIVTINVEIINPSEQILKEGYSLTLADAFGDPDLLDKDDGMISVRANKITSHRKVREISGEVMWPGEEEIEHAKIGQMKRPVSLEWAALGTKHFALILRPDQPLEGATMTFRRTSKTTASLELHVPPRSTGTGVIRDTFHIYAGPKDYAALAALPGRQQEAINYWYFGRAATLGVKMLRDKLGGIGLANYGIAIVTLALALRLVMWPANAYNLRSMADLKLATEKLADIDSREPPKDDIVARQAWVKEARPWEDLQRKAAIGAAIPLLIFLPVMLVLYYAFETSYEFYRQPLGLWITDISKADPYYILPLLAGAAMAFYLRKTRPDIASGKTWYAMPALFGVFFAFFSAGIVLFWLTDTLLAIAQTRICKMGKRANEQAA